MRRVMKIWLLAIILFAVPMTAQADEPFVKISPSTESVQFGEIEFTKPSLIGPGAALYPSTFGYSSASLTLRVNSNCLHGPIMASVTTMRHRMGKTITPDRISVKSPITDGYVSMEKPVMISKPEMGSHEIDLSFKLKVNPFESAGRYKGTIMFTVMPLPY